MNYQKQERIALKKIKHSEFASQETNCYQAQVHFDGKHVADVENDGHGGCDNQHKVTGAHREHDAMQDYICEFEPLTDTGGGNYCYTCPVDLEMICGDLLTDWLELKHIKKLMRKKMLFIKDGKLHATKNARSAAQRDAWAIQAQDQGYQVLNTKTDEEALQLFQAHAS